MESKVNTATICLVVLVWQCSLRVGVSAQEDTLRVSSSGPLSTLLQPENLNNLAQNGQVLILIPSNANLSEWHLNNANYNLFKLNPELLFKRDHVNMDETIDGLIEEDLHRDSEIRKRVARDLNGGRQSRKIGLLGGFWNKPKLSPLFLVNGTVCRLINRAPVCTSLSTSGFRK